MLTLHHLETSRSHRILWLLEELGVPYTLQVYSRDPRTRQAPPELKAIHPLGKSPILTDDDVVVAESGAIIEYLAECYGDVGTGDLAHLRPHVDSPLYRSHRFWMHYAEGSLMNWLLMKLVFLSIPQQPMPFFVRPVARKIAAQVQARLINPNLQTARDFMEAHLAQNVWFAGHSITMADFQMSYAVDALVSRGVDAAQCPHLRAYKARMEARPAYQRALQKGGPVMPVL
jgi:glutathione S-transferase